MKKILIGLFALTLIGCTNSELENRFGGNKAQQQSLITRDQLIATGLNILMTQDEINSVKSGKELPTISLDNLSQQMLGKDGVQGLFSKVTGIDSQVINTAKVMAAYPGQMMSTENPNILIEAIKYLAKTAKGRQILEKGRYIFKNYSPVNMEQIKQLAQLYKFKYLFM